MGAVHLIRHGQASWGAEDYDALSQLGVRQSALVGKAWRTSNWAPTSIISGSLKRHIDTTIAAIDASGGDHSYEVDDGWDEYDHRALTAERVGMSPREFQPLLEMSLSRWMDGTLEHDGASYDDWHGSVVGSFERALEAAGSGQHVAVITSGGPIATVASHLLAGDDSLFIGLNAVILNGSVTTIINGSTGPRVLSFNEHAHLPRDVLTFR